MTAFFQAHLGGEEGVCPDRRNLRTTQLPHQLSGTQGTQLVRAPEKGSFKFSLCVFQSGCGFFHLFVFGIFCLFVCLDGLI